MIRIQVVRGLEPMFLKSGNCPYHLSIKSSCIKILLEPFCSSSLGVYWDQLWILLKRTFWFSRSGRGVHLGPCIFNKLPGAGPCCCTRPRSEPHGSLVCIYCTEVWKERKKFKATLGVLFVSAVFCWTLISLSRSLSLALCLSALPPVAACTHVIKEHFHKWKYRWCLSCMWRHKDSKLAPVTPALLAL